MCEWMYFVSFIHIPPQINTTFVLIINIVGIFFHFVGCLFIVLCLRFCFVLFRFVLLVCTVPSTRIGYSLLISIHWIHCYFPPMQFCLRMQSPIAIMCYNTESIHIVEAVKGTIGRLPCNITPSVKGDKIILVIWYKDGYSLPIYR